VEENSTTNIKLHEMYAVNPVEGVMPSSQPNEFIVSSWGNVDNKDMAIFVDMAALIKVYHHAKSSSQKEVGGFLIGYPMLEKEKLFVQITDVTPAQHVRSTG